MLAGCLAGEPQTAQRLTTANLLAGRLCPPQHRCCRQSADGWQGETSRLRMLRLPRSGGNGVGWRAREMRPGARRERCAHCAPHVAAYCRASARREPPGARRLLAVATTAHKRERVRIRERQGKASPERAARQLKPLASRRADGLKAARFSCSSPAAVRNCHNCRRLTTSSSRALALAFAHRLIALMT